MMMSRDIVPHPLLTTITHVELIQSGIMEKGKEKWNCGEGKRKVELGERKRKVELGGREKKEVYPFFFSHHPHTTTTPPHRICAGSTG
ncbi:hypothetical protein HFQ13_08755 [Acidithiobacillus sp. VAN18-1]|uniref:Uncharacterized protein n=1 Tax=Igneacidithiobacillus copahuensis TaxID=2724909 RepID=A0AAE2YQS5_9PROT|nr:hypothetical protein [Igneacidithiobacillus copahuensis]MBU2788291.1 hypothetical protein [Igneacidithiobacillus copahuensis]